MNTRTRRNVQAALAGEALAGLRYQLFAEQAREEGHDRIADVFASMGGEERREHFRALAGELGLVGTTRDNLRMALHGEITEHRSLYPLYGQQAREDGEIGVAARFDELAGDQHRHADVLRRELEEMDLEPFEVVGG